VPETGVHLELRTFLFLLVRDFIGERGAVGSDQFVYWDPSAPQQCLAPDLIVRLGAPPGPFPIWKTWERGAPHLGVEVVSPSDWPEAVWRGKIDRYWKAGFNEVVRFYQDRAARPLRIWDRIDDDLVERDLRGPEALLCDTLGLFWHVKHDPTYGPMLRLAHDPEGNELVLSAGESAKAAELAAREAELAAREAELAAREAELAALARIAELEAELGRRR
jgi:Uma2 family endonuclease